MVGWMHAPVLGFSPLVLVPPSLIVGGVVVVVGA